MPTYAYTCSQCNKRFTVVMSMKDHDRLKVKCPKCASTRVTQSIQGFFATTSKKS